jgi:hypothetical protein
MSRPGKVVVAQSAWPAPVSNASLRGIVDGRQRFARLQLVCAEIKLPANVPEAAR